MLRRVLLSLVVAALLAPGAAHAQSNPFAPLPQVQPTAPEPVAPASTADDEDDGLAGWQQVLIILAGGLLVIGIGWAIIGDARNRAPTDDDTPDQEEARSRQELDRKRAKQKARAADKRSRQARKRNR
jgi:hypothetical protein